MKRSLIIVLAAAAFGIAACSEKVPVNSANNTAGGNANVTNNSTPATPTATPLPANANVGEPAVADFKGTTGATEKKPTADGARMVTAVRFARHEGYDRVVFEFSEGKMPGYKIEYAAEPVEQCGSGDKVAVTGEGVLTVLFMPLAAHTDEGDPTIDRRETLPKLPMLLEIERVCDFEGEVEFALGLSKRTEYRVTELTGPMRLAIDIKHK
jgi:hypothetical protein